jgi:TRAP-type C4-dicarboxylate transport system permease large subunit
MYIGWFTPTEAASVGAFVALLLMLLEDGGKGEDGENVKLCFSTPSARAAWFS